MTTANELLFGTRDDARSALAGGLKPLVDRLGGISVKGFSLPFDDVVRAIETALDVQVFNLAFRAWREHDAVRAARRRTAASPGSRESVRLLPHRVVSRQKPRVEAEIGGTRVPIAELLLEVELRVSSVDLAVENGEISDVRPGSATGTAKLSASGHVIARVEERPLVLRKDPRGSASTHDTTRAT